MVDCCSSEMNGVGKINDSLLIKRIVLGKNKLSSHSQSRRKKMKHDPSSEHWNWQKNLSWNWNRNGSNSLIQYKNWFSKSNIATISIAFLQLKLIHSLTHSFLIYDCGRSNRKLFSIQSNHQLTFFSRFQHSNQY